MSIQCWTTQRVRGVTAIIVSRQKKTQKLLPGALLLAAIASRSSHVLQSFCENPWTLRMAEVVCLSSTPHWRLSHHTIRVRMQLPDFVTGMRKLRLVSGRATVTMRHLQAPHHRVPLLGSLREVLRFSCTRTSQAAHHRTNQNLYHSHRRSF